MGNGKVFILDRREQLETSGRVQSRERSRLNKASRLAVARAICKRGLGGGSRREGMRKTHWEEQEQSRTESEHGRVSRVIRRRGCGESKRAGGSSGSGCESQPWKKKVPQPKSPWPS